MDFEEQELESRDGEEDLKQFKDVCSTLSNLMKELLNLKLKAKSDNSVESDIIQKRIEGSLLFVTLKKLNRLDKLRLKRSRDLTHDAKQRVDTFHLQLENLLYEVFHLQKEVDKCLEFKSKDEDIELVSEEEFYRDAPTTISKAVNSSHFLKNNFLIFIDFSNMKTKNCRKLRKMTSTKKLLLD